MRLEKLTAQHLDAVLAFETLNREYFAKSVPDRGDDFFADYPARHAALLAMQEAGTDIFHVLVDEGGNIAGRVNLVYIEHGEAELGFRIGQVFAGRGLATEAVRQVIELAATSYGLHGLRASANVDNHGSCTVLLRNGFTIVGETTLDGHLAHRFTRELGAS